MTGGGGTGRGRDSQPGGDREGAGPGWEGIGRGREGPRAEEVTERWSGSREVVGPAAGRLWDPQGKMTGPWTGYCRSYLSRSEIAFRWLGNQEAVSIEGG